MRGSASCEAEGTRNVSPLCSSCALRAFLGLRYSRTSVPSYPRTPECSMFNVQRAMQLVVVSAVTAAVAAAMTIRKIVSQIDFLFIKLKN